MELIKKYQLPLDKVSSKKVQSTKAEMKSLAGLSGDIFEDNVTLRQEVIRRAGFRVFVPLEFALNFRYAASIYHRVYSITHHPGGLVYDGQEDVTSKWQLKFVGGGHRVYYEGLLPLEVLNKVRLAVGLGVTHITIHSNEECFLKDITPKSDPVIIGWQGLSCLFDYLVCNNQPDKKSRWYRTAPEVQYCEEEKNPFGFIIAIFGGSEVI